MPTRRALLPWSLGAALAAVTLLSACGAARPAATDTGAGARPARAVRHAPAARPALCGPVRVTRTGTVATPAATELSGLAASRDQPGVLWTHNDSGDRPRVLALRADGTLMADLDVPGAEALDWEDIALGPAPGGGRALYLADIGDNAAARSTIDVYRVPEPALPATGTTAPATRLRLRYPDGAHDAETLLVAPRNGELALVTKRLDGRSGVYVARAPRATGATVTLRRVAELRLGLGGLATAGDVSADGRVAVVRTYDRFVVWRVRPGESLGVALRRAPCAGRVSLAGEGQGEALALSRGGRSFYTVPEGPSPVVRRYAAARR